MIVQKAFSIFHPERFQGWNKKKQYFEGWYFKIVNRAEDKAYAVIPGLAIDPQGQGHAFIQILDGKLKTSTYHRFAVSAFKADSDSFRISINESIFTSASLQVTLPDFECKLSTTDNVLWPAPWYAPGIMGPFSFVPFMECYHGIVSMGHAVQGYVIDRSMRYDFDGGKGYTEKDWGRSFPSAYIWMQSNHFADDDLSLKLSVAKIPWLRSSFVGFIAGLWTGKELIRFTTYNNCQLHTCKVEADKVCIVMLHPKYILDVKVPTEKGTTLAAPINGFMNGKIEESMTANITFALIDRKSGKTILKDTGKNGGLEIAGKIDEITT